MKRMIIRLILVLALMGLCAAPSASFAGPSKQPAPSAPQPSGIFGRTFLFQYNAPVLAGYDDDGEPIYLTTGNLMLPIPATIIIYAEQTGKKGHVVKVAQVTADGEGNFQLILPPGQYLVVPEDWSAGPFFTYSADPQVVNVTRGLTTVTIAYPFSNVLTALPGN